MYIATLIFLLLKLGIVHCPDGGARNGTHFDLIILLILFAIDTVSTSLILRWKFGWFERG